MADKESEQAAQLLIVTKIPADLRAALAAEYPVWLTMQPMPPAQDRFRLLPGYTIAVTMVYAGANAKLMEALPDLRSDCVRWRRPRSDRFERSQTARGIAVTHTPDELTDDTSDAAIGLIFAVSRRMVEADRFVRSGRWLKEQMSKF